ncbi:hypothetical protein Tco_0423067, partial [Tanacetum coccineum]
DSEREENQDHRRSITRISLVEICRSGLGHILLDIIMVNVAIGGWTVLIRNDLPYKLHNFVQPAFTGAEARVWFFLSRINARTMSLSSATLDETAWVEELVLILATTALFLD